jgi:hypothetical protein
VLTLGSIGWRYRIPEKDLVQFGLTCMSGASTLTERASLLACRLGRRVYERENWMTSMEMDAFDELRLLARKTAALTRAAENVLDAVIQVDDEDSRTRLEDLAHLLGAASEAADATVEIGVQLALDLSSADRREEA